ncbi:MAG: TRAM domain-containing protein [Actinomycetes bacterium]
MSPRAARVPNVVVELLRLCVVVFFAGLGYEIAVVVENAHHDALGGIDPVWVGLLLGTAVGFVLGGVLGRATEHAVSRTERSLSDVSAEHIVAGVFGAIIGVLGASAIAWPVFLLTERLLAVPLFAFVLVTVGMLGFRVGAARRDGMLHLFGASAGLPPRAVSTAALPRVVDTSVAIDGRILDVVRAGFLGGRMVVPQPVLAELQGLADAADELRRGRGRRGLEVLETLRREPGVEVVVIDDEAPAVPEVDAKLVRMCLDRGAALLTLDTNLARSAALAGVKVMNLHALALALRPPVVAGDEVTVLLTKPGRESGQAVGYLDDGTMVVVERAREGIGSEARVQVTSVLTTANGRMVFARPQSIAGSRV